MKYLNFYFSLMKLQPLENNSSYRRELRLPVVMQNYRSAQQKIRVPLVCSQVINTGTHIKRTKDTTCFQIVEDTEVILPFNTIKVL